jgi:hypothetical protein
MNQTQRQTACELLDDVVQACGRTLRFGFNALQRMSWPMLLAACFMLALLLTVVPLALVLFVGFLLLKLVIGALVVGSRRQRKERPL